MLDSLGRSVADFSQRRLPFKTSVVYPRQELHPASAHRPSPTISRDGKSSDQHKEKQLSSRSIEQEEKESSRTSSRRSFGRFSSWREESTKLHPLNKIDSNPSHSISQSKQKQTFKMKLFRIVTGIPLKRYNGQSRTARYRETFQLQRTRFPRTETSFSKMHTS